MKEAKDQLDELSITNEQLIISAHRTPERLFNYAESAVDRGLEVIIAGAGGAAHLPGMIAAITPLPVIGVPVKSKSMSGLDSLYSIVQMPPGVPVATVAINGAKNAGILAAQILGVYDVEVRNKVAEYKKNMEDAVLEKAKKLEDIGPSEYLK